MEKFQAYRISKKQDTIQGHISELTLNDLSPGEVVIRAEYSSINYKDALAATGRGRIITKFPMVGGIDVAGVVETSEDARYKPGQVVLVTGYELGTGHDGGYAQFVRVPADWIVPLPAGISTREAMIIGTAGFTAALCIHRMEQNGLAPERGKILVSGASGGVGNMALDMLSAKGYDVTALTGKMREADSLKQLGANEILDRNSLEFSNKPLEPALWAGAIDNIGGDILAWLTRTIQPWGVITSVGLAGGAHLNTTVMPFILRGVSLLGVTSSGCPAGLRSQIWQRIATDLKPNRMDKIFNEEVSLNDLDRVFNAMLAGQTQGRTLVKISDTA